MLVLFLGEDKHGKRTEFHFWLCTHKEMHSLCYDSISPIMLGLDRDIHEVPHPTTNAEGFGCVKNQIGKHTTT